MNATRGGVRLLGPVALTGGIISVVAGVLIVVYPSISLTALCVVAGIDLVVLGAVALAEAIVEDGDGTARGLMAVLGLLGVVAGLILIRHPGHTLETVILAVGLWLVASGIVAGVGALVVHEGRGRILVGALVDIVVGALVLALPKLSLETVAVLVGIGFILRGLLLVARGAATWRVAQSARPVEA